VVVANPLQVRLIAEARIKTDKVDAAVLAQLYASGFLPEVWIADERTQALRRQVARRSQIVRQRTRLKKRDPFRSRQPPDPTLHGDRSLRQERTYLTVAAAPAAG